MVTGSLPLSSRWRLSGMRKVFPGRGASGYLHRPSRSRQSPAISAAFSIACCMRSCSCGGMSPRCLSEKGTPPSSAPCRDTGRSQCSSTVLRITAAWRVSATLFRMTPRIVHDRIEALAAQDHGRRCPCHLVAVDDENNRRTEQLGQFGRAVLPLEHSRRRKAPGFLRSAKRRQQAAWREKERAT